VIAVLLSYKGGAQKEVLLAGVPRVGEQIRLRDSHPESPALLVEHVLWMEGGGSNGTPEVILAVRTSDRS
jgi:hypothetical protein